MLVKFIDKLFYNGYNNNWDDKIFSETIIDNLNTQSKVLDLGAGAGIIEEMNFKAKAASVCGIDLDPRVMKNQFLHERKISSVYDIPYADNYFDVVFCNNVMEHIEFPELLLREVHRVLKPGGTFLFKTTNKYHYVPLVAKFTPLSFHKFYNKLRGRDADDTFNTFYKFNNKAKIEEICIESAMIVKSLNVIEGRPEYMRLSFFTYLFGLFYERVVNSSLLFENFRVVIYGQLNK